MSAWIYLALAIALEAAATFIATKLSCSGPIMVGAIGLRLTTSAE